MLNRARLHVKLLASELIHLNAIGFVDEGPDRVQLGRTSS